jgi:5'-methylthioadenosine phosphorylase
MIGIIGGSGLYEGIEGLRGEWVDVKTPYGNVKVLRGDNFAFVSRHGNPPKPPHSVNYHANIMAFREIGVEEVIAISSVGSLRDDIPPGSILLPTDLLDFTPRVWTYHDEDVFHANLYEPFCPPLREKVSKIAGVRVGGTYATTKGPQFETRGKLKCSVC